LALDGLVHIAGRGIARFTKRTPLGSFLQIAG
jgi:hypothetical protein